MGRKPERTEPLERATFTLRKDQIEFLRTQGNASQLVRDAVDKIIEEKVSGVMSKSAKIFQLTKSIEEIDLKIKTLDNDPIYVDASQKAVSDWIIRENEGYVSEIEGTIRLIEEKKLPEQCPVFASDSAEIKYSEEVAEAGGDLYYARMYWKAKQETNSEEAALAVLKEKLEEKKSTVNRLKQEKIEKSHYDRIIESFRTAISELREEKDKLLKHIEEL